MSRTYPIKTDIIPLLRHLVEAIRPFAEGNFVGLVFKPEAKAVEFSFPPLDIIKVVGQILCQVIAFTPSGFEARLSVELAGDVQEKRLVIGIVNTGVRACLEVVLWKRKWPILGSHEAHFRGHSSAMGEEIAEMRFQKRTFAAQMTTSKHALSLGALKEITAGLPLPVKVSSFDSEGTRFEIQISIDPEEAASENIPTAKSEKEGGNVPVLYQKLRQRMHAYATSVKNMEEAIAREQSQREQVFLKKVNAIILANLGREDFDVRALARSLALSRTQLYRRLQPLIHLPPSRYIRFIRLQKAKEFLEKGEMDVGEACFRVGFVSKSHFTRAFQRQFGFNPSYLRRSHTKQKTPS